MYVTSDNLIILPLEASILYAWLMGPACQQHAVVKNDFTLHTIPKKLKIFHPSLHTLTNSHTQPLNPCFNSMPLQHCDFFNNGCSIKLWKWCSPSLQHCQSRVDAKAKWERESLMASVFSWLLPHWKEIQNWHEKPMASEMTEKQRCFVLFGCREEVVVNVLNVWGSLIQFDLPPDQGHILHLLWTLFLLKCYPTKAPACAAASSQKR
jgi:hypothetical protein